MGSVGRPDPSFIEEEGKADHSGFPGQRFFWREYLYSDSNSDIHVKREVFLKRLASSAFIWYMISTLLLTGFAVTMTSTLSIIIDSGSDSDELPAAVVEAQNAADIQRLLWNVVALVLLGAAGAMQIVGVRRRILGPKKTFAYVPIHPDVLGSRIRRSRVAAAEDPDHKAGAWSSLDIDESDEAPRFTAMDKIATWPRLLMERPAGDSLPALVVILIVLGWSAIFMGVTRGI